MLTTLLTVYALGALLTLGLLKVIERVEYAKVPIFKGFLCIVLWPVLMVVAVISFCLFMLEGRKA